MDWSEHENLNTPWLATFAFGGLLIAFADVVLLFLRWPRDGGKIGGYRCVDRQSGSGAGRSHIHDTHSVPDTR
ncbi:MULTISPECIES: hypothetical protein [Sphingomonadaceae]|jgi:hypothetical protein|uniref:Uncharacterized protein n=2 Tax=Sphingomonadaceae TaxID=41297 RepID=A0A2A4FSG5_9SPHN|nr:MULTISPECIES: hypothetical protein [Sphingomonadaceae]AMK20220.1 hypothetical protein K663_19308 [Sphingobium sp. MI1205]ATE67702.1 hypothetical protein CMV14_24515 [Rhizorhabdus dicambivorans]PCE40341.1 hypothetical protein COO09_20935 [Rhizorhabdus dicambivorans]QDC40283.1 hypothetical protein FIL70_24400 [Sphingobium fuliginis ATCC 27551]